MAVNATSTVPASESTDSNSQPSSTPAGGGAARPARTSLTDPFRATRRFYQIPGIQRQSPGRHVLPTHAAGAGPPDGVNVNLLPF